jgi:peroxin-14
MSSSEISPRHVRPDMVSSAISFLKDAKVQQSTVSQRVSFLESKGLSPDEIDEALRQTGASGAITAGQAAQAGPSHSVYPQQAQQQYGSPAMYYQNGYGQSQIPPQSRDRDWRDWFIMAVVSGTVGYGVIALARKYLFPHLQPPNQHILEEDRDALTAKYDEVAAQLAALDAETKAVKAGVEEQKEAIEKSIQEVEDTVKSLREADKRRADDMDTVKSEVDAMKDSLARMFEKTKEAQTASLTELQSELKSLKSLLVSRNSAAPQAGLSSSVSAGGLAGRPYSPFGAPVTANTEEASPSFTNTSSPRPSIPAWQLADTSSNTTATTTKSTVADEPTGTSAAQAGSENAKESASSTSS